MFNRAIFFIYHSIIERFQQETVIFRIADISQRKCSIVVFAIQIDNIINNAQAVV